MKKRFALLLLCASNAWSASVFSPEQEARIQALIGETLVKHPEILAEAAEAYNQQAQGKMDANVKQVIKENEAFLYHDAASPRWGSSTPALTLVVFTDYNCPYCKQLDPVLEQIVKDFPQVAVAFKFLPYRSPSSVSAAQEVLNVWKQQPARFPELNHWLMAKKGYHDDASIGVAKNKANVSLSVSGEDGMETINKSLAIAEKLGIQGTPATLIGNHLLPGYLPYDSFKAVVVEQLAQK